MEHIKEEVVRPIFAMDTSCISEYRGLYENFAGEHEIHHSPTVTMVALSRLAELMLAVGHQVNNSELIRFVKKIFPDARDESISFPEFMQLMSHFHL
jgi:hypothetical protein